MASTSGSGKKSPESSPISLLSAKLATLKSRGVRHIKPMDAILWNPFLTLFLVVLLTGFFFFNMFDLNVTGDPRDFLPEGDPSSELLLEVEEDWSTNVMVVYVELPADPGFNITRERVLRQMSDIEDAINPVPGDQGLHDDVIYVLSISAVVKEINSSGCRFGGALRGVIEDQVGADLSDFIGNATINDTRESCQEILGDENIPPQNRIDQIINEIPENGKKKLMADADGDGHPDRAVIVVGVVPDARAIDIMENVSRIINEQKVNEADPWCPPDDRCWIDMTLTGPIPISVLITDKAFDEFWRVFPIACLFVAIALVIFHNLKVLIITGTPTLFSVFWTLGIVGVTGVKVTPTIIVVGPILLALGVSYGLHLTNRYGEETGSPREKMDRTLKTTGKAVFLSAVTTMIGFVSLVFTPMLPIYSVGWALTGGIAISYLLTMVMVPCLTMILNYEKRGAGTNSPAWDKVASVPIRWDKVVVGGVVVLVVISLLLIPRVATDTDYLAMAPDEGRCGPDDEETGVVTKIPCDGEDSDIEPLTKIKQYSEEFDAGQLGMIVADGPIRGDSDDEDPSNDDPVANLEEMELLEEELNTIDQVNAISIIFLMKSVAYNLTAQAGPICNATTIINETLPDQTPQQLRNSVELARATSCYLASARGEGDLNFWDMVKDADNPEVQIILLDLFYDSISDEMRGVLVNQVYERSLIYVDMPILTIQKTITAVDQVDEAVINARGSGGGTIDFSDLTGVAAIAVSVNDLLLTSQRDSLVISILSVFAVLFLIFRSLKLAFFTTLPVVTVVALQPLMMILTGTSLSLVTVMIGSIVIGVGVDFSIHISQRFVEGGASLGSIKQSITHTGMSLMEAALTTIAGLVAAFFIPVPAIRPFVVMIIIMIVFSAIAALLFLPAMYSWLVKADKIEIDGSVSSYDESDDNW